VHPCVEVVNPIEMVQSYIAIKPWMLSFDGSSTNHCAGAKITIVIPNKVEGRFMSGFELEKSNNQAGDEALNGLQLWLQ
jgi:hypothetical protein